MGTHTHTHNWNKLVLPRNKLFTCACVFSEHEKQIKRTNQCLVPSSSWKSKRNKPGEKKNGLWSNQRESYKSCKVCQKKKTWSHTLLSLPLLHCELGGMWPHTCYSHRPISEGGGSKLCESTVKTNNCKTCSNYQFVRLVYRHKSLLS